MSIVLSDTAGAYLMKIHDLLRERCILNDSQCKVCVCLNHVPYFGEAIGQSFRFAQLAIVEDCLGLPLNILLLLRLRYSALKARRYRARAPPTGTGSPPLLRHLIPGPRMRRLLAPDASSSGLR